MATTASLSEPSRIDEPCGGQEYAAVLSQVATERRAVVVRRNGKDFAAVIPLEQLEIVQSLLARDEAERLAWQLAQQERKPTPPPQAWFDDTDNPFEPAQEPAR